MVSIDHNHIVDHNKLIQKTGRYLFNAIKYSFDRARAGREPEKFSNDPFNIERKYSGIERSMLQNFLVESFTVSGVLNYDLQEKLKELAVKIMNDPAFQTSISGKSVDPNKEFIRLAQGMIAKYNYTGETPPEGHLQTNLRTAISSAWNASNWNKINESGVYPALQYKTMADNRVREEHAKLHDRVWLIDDPVWDSIMPPNSYNCFPCGTEVRTQRGFKPIDCIEHGDLIYGGSGELKRVNFVFERFFDGDLIEIKVGDSKISATPNHRFLTTRGWICSMNLIVGDKIVKFREHTFGSVRIRDVVNVNSRSENCNMPIPGRESTTSETLNSNTQIGKKKVHPVWINSEIEYRSSLNIGQVAIKTKFSLTHLAFKIRVKLRGRIKSLDFRLRQLGSYFRSFISRGCFKLFRNFSILFTRFFSLTQVRRISFRFPFLMKFLKIIRCGFSTTSVVYPLNFYSLTSFSRGDAIEFHNNYQCARLDSPSFADHTVSESTLDIEIEEGFTNGAPLDFFNSLDDFNSWLSLNGHLVELNTISNISDRKYIGNIYNLEIEDDNSFITKLGVVHNCRCRAKPITHDELGQHYVEPTTDQMREDIKKEAGISKEFDRNSGKVQSIWQKWLDAKLERIDWDKVTKRLSDYADRKDIDVLKYLRSEEKFTVSEVNETFLKKEFPDDTITTPLGNIKLGSKQFQKMIDMNRTYLGSSLKKLLSNPDVILVDVRDGEAATIFIKSFKGDKRMIYVTAVYKEVNGEKIITSIAEKSENRIQNIAKTTKLPIYIRRELPSGTERKNSGDQFGLRPDSLNFEKLPTTKTKFNEIWGRRYWSADLGRYRSVLSYITYRVDGFELTKSIDGVREIPALISYAELDKHRQGVMIYE